LKGGEESRFWSQEHLGNHAQNSKREITTTQILDTVLLNKS